MYNDDFLSKIPNPIRWVMYVPLPFIATRLLIWFGSICTYLATGIQFSDTSPSPLYAFLYVVCDNISTPALMGILGYAIAPKKKFVCGLIQMAIWGLVVIVSITSAITYVLVKGNTGILYSFYAIKLYAMAIICFVSIIVTTKILFKNEKDIELKNNISIEEI